MEVSRMFFDVGFKRHEILVYEGRSFLVAVRFGFQPSACSSRGSGAEIDEHRFLGCLGFGEHRVRIFLPMH